MMKRLVLLVPVIAACTSASPDSFKGWTAGQPRAVIVAPPANFGPPPGILSGLDVASRSADQNLLAEAVGDDPVLRRYGSTLYIVNRNDGNNVTLVSGSDYSLIGQIGTGSSSNPYDVAVVGDKLYVPALGTAGVVELSASGQAITKTIDLGSAVGDPDGQPDCASAYVVGTDVYVACEVLDDSDPNLTPRGSGVIAVIDSATDTVRTTVTLPVPNPQPFFEQLPGGDLVIPAQDYAAADSGCIVDITPGATPTAACLVANTAINGTVNHIAVDATGALWLSVSSFDFSTVSLSKWANGTATNAISGSAEVIDDVAVCPDGTIAAADGATGSSGFRLFDGTAELTTAAIPFGLPPGFGNGLDCYTP